MRSVRTLSASLSSVILALYLQPAGAQEFDPDMEKEFSPVVVEELAKMQEGEPSLGVKAFDLVVSRPTTLFSSLVGGAAWLGDLPFSLTGLSNTDTVRLRKAMVDYPLAYTFKRPLGDFGEQDTLPRTGTYYKGSGVQ